MKAIAEISLMLVMLFTGGLALAQSGAMHEPVSPAPSVAAARCVYTDNDALCSPGQGRSQNAAQFPRRAPSPPAYPPTPPQYRVHAAPGPVLKGALIGSLIGFGFGAAGGKHRGGQDRLGLGALVGFIGAGLGAAIEANHSLHRYHYPYGRALWPYEELDEMSSRKPAGPSSHSTK